ncbi:restriction endonuclease subunit S [Clostridium perfringens]|uniref:restriction endonuclease subunit S n=1 Tax=Clostridium perfringens TaxID=1502 RepID=UPI0018E47F8D|nr:restriction endonuclease subunit S [Clostridium perfringens]MBI6062303.1 restriction endonuclease subunit S [Clostridium perfringens]
MKYIKLKDICDLQNGFAFKSSDYIDSSTVLNCRMSNIRPNAKFDIMYNPKYLPENFVERYKEYILNDGDLIIAMTDLANDPKILGVPTIVETKGNTLLLNQRVGKLIILDDKLVDKYYLKYSLSLPQHKPYYKKFAGGGLQINIGKEQILNLKIPISNIEIQRKVVEILDKSQELIDKRKKQIEELDLLIKSKFIEMFGDPVKNPLEWQKGKIADIIVKTQYGTSNKADEFNGDFKVLRMNNITYDGNWDFTSIKYINLDEKEQKKYLVYKGEVLFNRTNSKELVGKTAVYKEDEPMAYAGYLVKAIPNERANGEFISAYMNTKYVKDKLLNMAKNIVGMANINAEEFKKIDVYIPPIELQNQFADFVKQVDKLKFEMEKSLKELEDNFNSLMQKAFKGELFK